MAFRLPRHAGVILVLCMCVACQDSGSQADDGSDQTGGDAAAATDGSKLEDGDADVLVVDTPEADEFQSDGDSQGADTQVLELLQAESLPSDGDSEITPDGLASDGDSETVACEPACVLVDGQLDEAVWAQAPLTLENVGDEKAFSSIRLFRAGGVLYIGLVVADQNGSSDFGDSLAIYFDEGADTPCGAGSANKQVGEALLEDDVKGWRSDGYKIDGHSTSASNTGWLFGSSDDFDVHCAMTTLAWTCEFAIPIDGSTDCGPDSDLDLDPETDVIRVLWQRSEVLGPQAATFPSGLSTSGTLPNEPSQWFELELAGLALDASACFVDECEGQEWVCAPTGMCVDEADWLGPPELLAPLDGAVVWPDVLLEWQAVPAADSYQYQVVSGPDFQAPGVLVASGVGPWAATGLKLFPLVEKMPLSWRVRALLSGLAGPWSIAWHFDVPEGTDPTCEPQCASTQCGPDGCGGICGACDPVPLYESAEPGDWTCYASGWCGPPEFEGFCEGALPEGLGSAVSQVGAPTVKDTVVSADTVDKTTAIIYVLAAEAMVADGETGVPFKALVTDLQGNRVSGAHVYFVAVPILVDDAGNVFGANDGFPAGSAGLADGLMFVGDGFYTNVMKTTTDTDGEATVTAMPSSWSPWMADKPQSILVWFDSCGAGNPVAITMVCFSPPPG